MRQRVALQGIVAMPLADVAAGRYEAAQQVALSCDTEGAAIHYTTDGTLPTKSSARIHRPFR